jgi:hypothetical protein
VEPPIVVLVALLLPAAPLVLVAPVSSPHEAAATEKNTPAAIVMIAEENALFWVMWCGSARRPRLSPCASAF